MVALTGSSSKLKALVERLPALLRRHPRTQPPRQRQQQHRLSHDQINQLVAEYQAGASMVQLATHWNVHQTTAARHVKRAGVTLRRQGVPNDRRRELVRLYGEGWSCRRLAERYGCDAETVRQTLKRNGVKLRTPWERRR